MVKSTVDGSSVPSFLSKCYEMVEDQSTNDIISWSDSNNSFVIRNVSDFSQQLLPNYFKHNNFSSFMRQLNIYGFKKIDTDCWEFSNEGFIKGQKQLMKNIIRRKNAQSLNQPRSAQQSEKPNESHPEIENFGLWKEIESLKIDKNALTKELFNLRQLQETSENKLLVLRKRLQGMETDQQQMLSFLITAMQSPGFLSQFLHQKENNRRKPEIGKNIFEEFFDEDEALVSDNMLIEYYHPSSMDEDQNPIPSPNSNSDKSPDFDFFDGLKDLYIHPDFMKILMEEKLTSENHNSLEENGPQQQLLLSNHLLGDTVGFDIDDSEEEMESIEMESKYESQNGSENRENLDTESIAELGIFLSER